ncbi:hypothetical protein RchiOBHm_Chr7g0222921 [Rosa chinensis]|uniref:Uncharacterized protein n=1 Tax=Rosa chinensis TaxID=74649 RepID=A0A2P6PDE8_ROSCH|nr:hypothetical protein RchiOBHm_Chr7g0222921 [Rosa chinensis]
MALSSAWSPTLLTTTQSSSPPKLVHSHSPLTSLTFPSKPTTTTHTIVPALSHKWRARISFFPAFSSKGKDAKTLKVELLDAIASLDRGAGAGVSYPLLFVILGSLFPRKRLTVEWDYLCGKRCKWRLLAHNSYSRKGATQIWSTRWKMGASLHYFKISSPNWVSFRPKFLRSRVNYQAINVDTLRAQNMESWPTFNQVTADLIPLNARKVAVKFDYFKIAGLVSLLLIC